MCDFAQGDSGQKKQRKQDKKMASPALAKYRPCGHGFYSLQDSSETSPHPILSIKEFRSSSCSFSSSESESTP